LLPQFGVKLDTAQIMTVAECDIKEDTQVTLLMDVPPSFEELQKIYDASRDSKLVLVLLAGNAAYAKVLSKKTNSEIHQLAYNPNKLISTESKLIRLVEASYHLNRLAFYAYGSYLQYFSANLFKSIFNTQALDVAAVARGFGFQVPPRVIAKPGQFLNRKAQDRKKREKRE
jgi:ATP-dependent RNA helicase DDX18/HAS1